MRVVLAAALLLAAPPVALAETVPVARFALVAGANSGGLDRVELRYAESDALAFARVLDELGGVAPENRILISQPEIVDLEQGLERLGREIEAAKRAGARRTELVVYYSGHADEAGLLLGDDRYSYATLRRRLEEIDADVRIAVLDACASGAITRLKGGRRRRAFEIDESSDVRGHVFLTSSSEDESAQESDQLGASFFTHYLISGLRGAADVSGDGAVTLNEAYRFAFDETLGRTAATRGGAQHPAYDIAMSGTGDVVMTDLRQTSVSLTLGEALGGRCFVRNGRDQLVVELGKLPGRRITLGLEPDDYSVRCQEDERALLARRSLAEGDQVVLEPGDFEGAAPEPTILRGGVIPQGWLDGRNEIALGFGFAAASDPEGIRVADRVSTVRYSHWLRPDLAVGLSVSQLEADVPPWNGAEAVGILVEGRREFLGATRTGGFRPYFTLGLGPFLYQDGFPTEDPRGFFLQRTTTVFGGRIGAGFDVQLNRRLLLGARAAWEATTDFPEAIDGRTHHSAFTVSVSLGWLFGRGEPPD